MSETLQARVPVVRRAVGNGEQTMIVWTDELRTEVRRRWNDGQSAGQIGKFFGMSRSSVIGFIHRHNVATQSRNEPAQPRAVIPKPEKPKPQPRPRISRPKPPPPPPEPIRAPRAAPPPETAWEPLEGSNPLPWTQRPFGACAWPVGFADDGETLSCCEPVREGKTPQSVESYCGSHALRMFQQPKESHARFSRGVRRWAR